MRAVQDYQDILSENLSMQSVPGYRQILPTFSTALQGATSSAGAQQSGSSGNPAALQVKRVIDFAQGPLQPSPNPYHVAIQGQAFFEVKNADGTTSYTRNGEFTLSPKGQLLTSDGASVLNSGGSAISFSTTNSAPVSISNDGTISQGDTQVGKLGVVHFANPQASLTPGPGGRFLATNSNDAQSGLAPNDKILQNTLEESNGNAVGEMANMLQAMRFYETNAKMVQAVDNNQSQLISTVGGRPQA